MRIAYTLAAVAAAPLAAVLASAMRKNVHVWLPGYLKQAAQGRPAPPSGGPVHVAFCFADHFEPGRGNAPFDVQARRVDEWVKRYPEAASRHVDSDGRHPQHTFFYPGEEYHPEHLDKLARLCKAGFGDVEIHLHHDHDSAETLTAKLEGFKAKLAAHGLLERDENGRVTYGFIHGNWALDNSRRDGRYCGVNNELTVLKETGCYADFTFPSAPDETQTSRINSIYYATDDPAKPKSHDTGRDVAAGEKPSGDLMIIQGPLTLNWTRRKWGVLPRIEYGNIDSTNPPYPERADRWMEQHIHVKGRPDWVFVKVYTHGAREEHFDTLLGRPMDELYGYLETRYNDGKRYKLHYVTARGMYRKIKELESAPAEVTA